ncbi:DNA starvation/stationary phase protection protein Dps [Limnoglobus roseus]|uniref:DNA starvation/stationary phase protection protein Dps n=1 Tax=Limnoglobus roseus TaxID=2598579 RepID=A0A5C1A782_9BACT|nr:DNA starvation/stationary phase protection protein Dps [Limnoglobus roseus]QEL14133.1 DNA starvation/stationary phase protection protein Dps [Limnoglobus roseus]
MHPTKNSLSAATREKVAGILNQVLANLTDLYSQTKQAHWNVRGPRFIMLHELFDKLADTVEDEIDPVAERITALGGVAKGTIRLAAANSKLPEFPADLKDENAYVTGLVERYSQTANDVRKSIDEIDGLGDTGSADLITGTVRELDQALWFLESHLQ